MNIILLSGGSGRRLWPLSNEVRSKQFLKIFKKDDGCYESMVQRMCRMISDVDQQTKIVIATSENQVSSIRAQLEDSVDISIEPCRRNTFPAIVLATAYLHDVKGIDAEEVVIVCPVDPYVDYEYFDMLKKIYFQAKKGEAHVVLMGVEPTYPSEKYGYIIPKSKQEITAVDSFKEKPKKIMAEEFIAQGALWNSGIFAFKISYILSIAEKQLGSSNYLWLFDNYSSFKDISFDYAVVEKEKKLQVMRFAGQWKDLGTWNTLTEAMSEETVGNAVAVDCKNTHIINELQIPLIALGVSGLAIAATPDGILVTEKNSSDRLKEYVIEQRPMYEQRFWGEYKVLDYHIQRDGQNFLTKHLIVISGRCISYQLHHRRAEMWIFVKGAGIVIIVDEVRSVGRGDYVCISPGEKHAVKAYTDLHIIEVQIGDELSEDDIERFDLNWNDID